MGLVREAGGSDVFQEWVGFFLKEQEEFVRASKGARGIGQRSGWGSDVFQEWVGLFLKVQVGLVRGVGGSDVFQELVGLFLKEQVGLVRVHTGAGGLSQGFL